MREEHAPPLAGPAAAAPEPAPAARPWRYVSPGFADASGRRLTPAEASAAFEAIDRRERNRRKALRKARR